MLCRRWARGQVRSSRDGRGVADTTRSFPLLQIFIRNRLKYALTGREVTLVVKQRLIKIDNKVRTDETYPAGFMGTLSAPSQRSLLYLEARHRE